MHFNMFSEGVCGKMYIFYNVKSVIEDFLFSNSNLASTSVQCDDDDSPQPQSQLAGVNSH